MADGKAEITIAGNPDEVWKLLGDFGGIAEWMPGMESCEVQDDVRVIKTMGIEIHEKLGGRDDAARTISNSIVQSPMPLEHHEATITVTPEGDGAHVIWAVEVRPDEMLGAFVPIYQQSLEAAKARVEG
jgi:uncharacterized protein YndB with AHSA1/START domain